MTKEELFNYGIVASDFKVDADGEYLIIDSVKYSFMQVVAIKRYLKKEINELDLMEYGISCWDLMSYQRFDLDFTKYLTAQIWNWQTTRNHRGTHTELDAPKLSNQ